MYLLKLFLETACCLFSALSILAGSIDRLATEIRHLQRTEVLEAEESFGKGQKVVQLCLIKGIQFYQRTYQVI